MELIEKSMEKCEPCGRIIPPILKKRKLLFVLVLGIFTTLFVWTFNLKLALAAEKELLINPGFEEKKLEPWVSEGGEIDTQEYHFGKRSVKFVSMEKWKGCYQDIEVKENTAYRMGAWIRIENAYQMHVKVIWFNAKGEDIAGKLDEEGKSIVPERDIYICGGTDGTKDWYFISKVVKSPEEAAKVGINLLAGGSLDGKNPGITWFDDVSVKEVEYQKEADFSFEEIPEND